LALRALAIAATREVEKSGPSCCSSPAASR
jgi:hypothetical protein